MPPALMVLAALTFAAIAALLALRARRRRRARALLADDVDFDVVFPSGPDDQPFRGTVAGRRTARR